MKIAKKKIEKIVNFIKSNMYIDNIIIKWNNSIITKRMLKKWN